MNSVYFDNSSLEVYHARLDERPNSAAVRISWFGPQDPTEVHLERKVQQRPSGVNDDEVKDEIELPENLVVEFLEGEITPDAVQEFWRTKVSFLRERFHEALCNANLFCLPTM